MNETEMDETEMDTGTETDEEEEFSLEDFDHAIAEIESMQRLQESILTQLLHLKEQIVEKEPCLFILDSGNRIPFSERIHDLHQQSMIAIQQRHPNPFLSLLYQAIDQIEES